MRTRPPSLSFSLGELVPLLELALNHRKIIVPKEISFDDTQKRTRSLVAEGDAFNSRGNAPGKVSFFPTLKVSHRANVRDGSNARSDFTGKKGQWFDPFRVRIVSLLIRGRRATLAHGY